MLISSSPPSVYQSTPTRVSRVFPWRSFKLSADVVAFSDLAEAELKSFLQFHKTGEEPLRDDEILILNGVLSLNQTSAGDSELIASHIFEGLVAWRLGRKVGGGSRRRGTNA